HGDGARVVGTTGPDRLVGVGACAAVRHGGGHHPSLDHVGAELDGSGANRGRRGGTDLSFGGDDFSAHRRAAHSGLCAAAAALEFFPLFAVCVFVPAGCGGIDDGGRGRDN